MTLEGIIAAVMLIAILISLVLAIALTSLYLKLHQLHIALWSIALYLMAIRVLTLLVMALGYMNITRWLHSMNDVYLILVDIIWIYGVFHFLGYERKKKAMLVYGVITYIMIITILSAINSADAILIGEGITLLIIHPALLSYLFWIFYRSGREVNSPAMRYLGIAFLLWAIDFILFGIPYFVYKDPIAGALGWTIGLAFRFMLIWAFTEMRKEAVNAVEPTKVV